MDFKILPQGSTFIKSREYCPNPVRKYGVPAYADVRLNPRVIGTLAYSQYWEEQLYYIKNGYTTGGVWLPGRYYKFVNFDPVQSVMGSGAPEIHDFQLDYALWIEDLKKRRKNAYVPKARRKSVSVMTCGMVIDYGYRFIPDYHAAVVAGLDEYAQDFMDKWRYINANMVPEFRLRRLTNNEDDIVSGWKEKKDGLDLEFGTFNTIYARTVNKSANVLKGKFENDIVLEESGENNLLLETMSASEDCLMYGSTQEGMFHIYGCVCAGTKVWSNDGRLLNIEDLQKRDGILGFSGSGASKENIVWMKPPAQKNCYRITTSGNNVIECSEDHPLMWSRNRHTKMIGGRIEKIVTFKRAKDVGVGDQLLMADEISVFGKRKVWMPRFIGLLIGDGNVTVNQCPSIGSCEEGVMNYLEKNFEHVVTKAFTTKDGRAYKNYSFRGLFDRIKEAGIYGLVGQNKRLPADVADYDEKSLSELLGGYFDADGNVCQSKKHGTRIVLTSSVIELLQQVKFQLTKFGIYSQIVREKRNNDNGYGTSDHIYRLYIAQHKSVLRFRKNIKFLCEHKQKRLLSVADRVQRMSCDRYAFEMNKENGKGETYGDFVSGLRHVFVKKVEFIGMRDVYNLNAGVTHTYLANNFVTGNTGGNMSKGSKGFKDVYFNLSKYNAECYYLPARVFYHPYYAGAKDKHGNIVEDIPNLQHLKPHERVGMSDTKRAQEHIDAKKAELLKSPDLTKYFEYTQNNPTDIKEIFRKTSTNNFPLIQLNDQGFKIESEPRKYGKFTLKDKVDDNGMMVMPREVIAEPARDDTPEKDCVLILHDGHPVPGYRFLDVGGIDSYDQDQSKISKSLGAMVVFRRQHSIPNLPAWLPVAIIRNRPDRKEKFYDMCLRLSIYYNLHGSVLIDRAKMMVGRHIQDAGCQRFLSYSPRKFESPNTKQGNEFGVSLNLYTKPRMVGVLQTYFSYHSEKVWFPQIIDEALDYDEYEDESDNDTVDALGIALMKAHDMIEHPVDDIEMGKANPYQYPEWSTDRKGHIVDSTTVDLSHFDPTKEDMLSYSSRINSGGEDDGSSAGSSDTFDI